MMFSEVIPHILAQEGGYVNNPADRGGATNLGITQRNYSAWLHSKGQSFRDVALMTVTEAKSVYLDFFWTPSKCMSMPDWLRHFYFDTVVNSGAPRAAKIVQEAAGVLADGRVGPKTLAAVNEFDSELLLSRAINIRFRFFGEIVARDKSQLQFIAGWMARNSRFIK